MDQILLAIYDELPDLLLLTRKGTKRSNRDIYALQDALREDYRDREKPFRWSMPYRHLFVCPKCGIQEAAVHHEMENPAVREEESHLRRVTLWEEEVHEVRVHGGRFEEECREFLRQFYIN